MDKNTLSNYGWIVIAVLVLSVMIALATPFGEYIKAGVESTAQGLFDTSEKALNVVGMSAGPKEEPEYKAASGNCISVGDADSNLQTLKVNLSSDTISDFSGVKLTKLGKNLFDMNAYVESGHVTITGDEMLWNKTEGMLRYTPAGIIDGQSYTLQLNTVAPAGKNVQALIYYTDGLSDKVQTKSNGEEQLLTLTSNAEKTIDFIIFGAGGGMAIGTIFKEVQFELGTVATEYEPYNKTEYNASENGTVSGVKNSSSAFTLVTDNDDVTINCEYIKKKN